MINFRYIQELFLYIFYFILFHFFNWKSTQHSEITDKNTKVNEFDEYGGVKKEFRN